MKNSEMYRPLYEKDPQIAAAIDNETRRQHEGLELIASENFVSEAVLEAAGSVFTNKYAEGYPGKRYYGGCEFTDVVENLARGDGSTCDSPEHDHAVMARPRPEDEIERESEACRSEARTLQDAQGTRQIAKPELIDKGERQHRVDNDQPQGIEEPRQVARHASPPNSKRDVQHVAHVHGVQHAETKIDSEL